MPLVWTVVAVSVVLLLMRLPVFTVQSVEVIGVLDTESTKTLQSLQGQSLFSRKISQVVAELKHQNLTIATLYCRRGVPSTLRCQASDRQAAAIWQRQDQRFAIDANGLIFAAAGSVTKPVIEDRAAQSVEIGVTVAGAELLGYYQKLITALASQGLTLDHLFVDQSLYQVGALLTGSTNAAIPFPATQPLTVLFAANRSLDDQIATLVLTLQQKSTAITSYIDVRVGEYVYFK